MRAALWLHRVAARVLLPRSLHAEYAAELEATVAARLGAASGPLARWLVLLGELVDLVSAAVRERRSMHGGGPSGPADGRAIRGGAMGGWSDVRTSLRSLARRPGLALGVTLTIGLGIGATTTIYGIVDGVILRPLPYEDPDRLVAIGALAMSDPADGATELQPLTDMSSEVYKRYRERARSFSQLGGVDPYNVVVSDENGLEQQIAGVRVTPELFDMLGAAPTLGRAFAPDEYAIEGAAVAMISWEYWQSQYGGDPGVLGRELEASADIGGRPTIVGILPRGFRPPEAFAIAGELPLVYQPLPLADPGPNRFVFFPINAVGRLRPGTTIEQAREEAERLFAEISVELASRPGPAIPGGAAAGIGVNDLHVQTVGETGRTLWVFLGAAALLLALTSMNAATMFLSRALDRTQELGVRVALGAGRGVVAHLLLVEAGALSLLGGLIGVLLAYVGMATFLRFAPTSIPRLSTVGVDGRVLAAAAAMTLGTAVAAGLLPALRFTARAPWERLQSASRSTSEAASRLRTALVGGQLALAVVLLSGAGLLFSSFLRLRSMDPGFAPDDLVVVGTSTQAAQRIRINGSASRLQAQNWDRVRDALSTVPGIGPVALANALPFQAPTWAPRLLLPGDEPDVVRPGIAGYVVSDGYLEALGTEVVSGRGLGPEDGPDGEPVLLVNEAFVRTQLGGSDPLGVMVTRPREGLAAQGAQVAMRIVGVVEDVVQARVEDGPRPAVYVPYRQADLPQLGSFWSVVRSARSTEALAPELRTVLEATNRTPRVVERMEDRMAETRATPRFQTFLIGTFAGVAMLLAVAGLHASLAHTVRRRQRELGVRIALGADRGSVLRMVLSQGLRVAVVGLTIGIVGTLAMSGLLEAFLYGMEPYDPLTLAGVALVLMLVSVAACLAPARRATTVDPVEVLGAE